MTDLRISTSHAACMNYLQLLVSTGYRYWTSGKMAPEKAVGFARKMAELYPIERNAAGRAYDKETGKASVQLVMFPYDLEVRYWLLATPGNGLIHEREKLTDAFELGPAAGFKPDGLPRYRLVLRKGKDRAKARWTWVFEPAHLRELRASLKQAADAGEPALEELFSRLKTIPLFAGIREQMLELRADAETTWKKQNRTPFPTSIPAKLPTMPRLTVFGELTLPVLVAQLVAKREERRRRAELEALDLLLDKAGI